MIWRKEDATRQASGLCGPNLPERDFRPGMTSGLPVIHLGSMPCVAIASYETTYHGAIVSETSEPEALRL